MVALTNRSQDELRSNGTIDLLQKAWADGINARIIAAPFGDAYRFNLYLVQQPKISENVGINLSGLTIRSSALYKPMLEAMGAETVSMEVSEVFRALNRGELKGFVFPSGGVARYGWHKFIRFKIEPGFWRSSAMLVINLNTYKSLTAKERREIDQAGLEFEKAISPVHRKIVERDEQKLVEAGVKLFSLKNGAKKAYLSTILDSTWQNLENRPYSVPFDPLKSALYRRYD